MQLVAVTVKNRINRPRLRLKPCLAMAFPSILIGGFVFSFFEDIK